MFFIHYKHTQLIVENIHFRRSNYVSFYLGLVSGVGLLLIASFQVNANVFIYLVDITLSVQDGATLSAIHYVGAVLLFGLGTVYCFMVTAIGWHVARQNGGDRWLKIISHVRIILCVLMLVGSVTGDCG